MPRNGADNDSDSANDSFRPSRRSYLKAAGAAAVSVPLFAGTGAAVTTRHGISFSTVVDMVADAGCDPTGSEPCDAALRSAAGSDTLLKFPSGTYKFTEKNPLNGYSNFGIVGDGDVTFTVPNDFNKKLLTINYGTGALLENITVDQSNATPCVQVAPNDGLEIHGLKMLGQGISSATGYGPGGGQAENALHPMVRSPGGEGMVENVVLHNQGRMGAYSRTGVWIGAVNEGTVTLRNCNVEGFSSNGVYASRTPGVVQVEGGLYKNNDLSQVRVGSSGSYVDGASCEADVSESRSPNPEDFLNASGIRIEKPSGGAGAAIRNCDVRIGPDVNASTGIKIWTNYGDFSIENTRVEFHPDQAYAIRAGSPDGSYDSPGGTFNNVSVTGTASDFVGVLIEDRPNTAIENCCVQQTGASRIGVALDNCDGSRVVDTTINSTGQALRIRNGDVLVKGLSTSGSCPAPNLAASSYDASTVDSSTPSTASSSSSESSEASGDTSDDSGATSSDSGESSSKESDDSAATEASSSESSAEGESSGNPDGAGADDELSGNIEESEVPEPPTEANLVITDTDTSGDRIPYKITTSGDIDYASAYGTTPDANDPISGNTVTGGVNEWRDSYSYEGEIISLVMGERGAVIKIDDSASTIKVLGTDPGDTEYSITVTGTLEHADESGDPITPDGHSVTGGVGTAHDFYTYTGELVQASIENGVSITTRPELLDE